MDLVIRKSACLFVIRHYQQITRQQASRLITDCYRARKRERVSLRYLRPSYSSALGPQLTLRVTTRRNIWNRTKLALFLIFLLLVNYPYLSRPPELPSRYHDRIKFEINFVLIPYRFQRNKSVYQLNKKHPHLLYK